MSQFGSGGQKYRSFSFNISPSNEYSGLIFSRIDLFDLLEVQGTLKSLLQHHSSKASILWCSPFFIVQFSHPYISSVQFSCSIVSDSLQPHGLQHARLPCPSPTPGGYSNSKSIELVMPSNHLILCCPSLLPSSILPSIRVFPNETDLHIRWPKYWSFSFNFSPTNEYSGLAGSPCSPRDSQESSPIPHFKSINSLVLTFLYSPTLTSKHDYWKNHSLD